MAPKPFLIASATGKQARDLVTECLRQFGSINGTYQLGLVYGTDNLCGELPHIIGRLKQETRVQDWVGTVGMAICTTGEEYYDQPALTVMLIDYSKNSYKLLGVGKQTTKQFFSEIEDWCREDISHLGIVHGDPTNPAIPTLIQNIADNVPGIFLVGGLTSSNFQNLQVANEITSGGLSGVIFSPDVQTVVGHTQGCTPLNQRHVVTKSEKNLLFELDNRPALDVFREDIGEVLAKDLKKVAGYIFAGFPIPFSDTNDYLVRNIVGFDVREKAIAVGDYLKEGSEFMFCRRDGNSAREDMTRMLTSMKSRLTSGPRGAVYYSCLGRGRHQFGEDSQELKLIQQELGDFPLIGFFANGEIFNSRLYGYTGVLTVFL